MTSSSDAGDADVEQLWDGERWIKLSKGKSFDTESGENALQTTSTRHDHRGHDSSRILRLLTIAKRDFCVFLLFPKPSTRSVQEETYSFCLKSTKQLVR